MTHTNTSMALMESGCQFVKESDRMSQCNQSKRKYFANENLDKPIDSFDKPLKLAIEAHF